MKTIISILLLTCISLSANAKTPLEKEEAPLNLLEGRFEKAKPCTIKINILITGRPSKTKNPCVGFGFRCIEWNKIEEIERVNPSRETPGKTQMSFEYYSKNSMKVTFPGKISNEKVFSLTQNETLPSIIFKRFGLTSMVALKGDYTLIDNRDGTISSVISILSK